MAKPGYWERRFLAERDRRYSEVAVERERAMQIKDKADEKAMDLARQIQEYKDEKANELREQIASERGLYATKSELAPLIDSESRRVGSQITKGQLWLAVGSAVGILGVIVAYANGRV